MALQNKGIVNRKGFYFFQFSIIFDGRVKIYLELKKTHMGK